MRSAELGQTAGLEDILDLSDLSERKYLTGNLPAKFSAALLHSLSVTHLGHYF